MSRKRAREEKGTPVPPKVLAELEKVAEAKARIAKARGVAEAAEAPELQVEVGTPPDVSDADGEWTVVAATGSAAR